MSRHKYRNQQGFTIVELLIATAVLSTILVLVTVLMVNIGNLYYKGINQARVQGATRNITDEVSQHLELSSGVLQATANASYPNIQAYCTSDTRYTFITGVQIGHKAPPGTVGPVYYHILWRDTNPTPGSCQVDATNGGAMTDASATNGTELIPPNSRLTAFCIGTIDASNTCNVSTISPYTLSVGIAYGDDDLLNVNGISTVCSGIKGDQFCATAHLTTAAVKRLTGNAGN